MNKKLFWLLTFLVLATGTLVDAQQPTKVPRIGWLSAAPLSANADRIEAFRKGLRELGYLEGKNIFIEWRGGKEKSGSRAHTRG